MLFNALFLVAVLGVGAPPSLQPVWNTSLVGRSLLEGMFDMGSGMRFFMLADTSVYQVASREAVVLDVRTGTQKLLGVCSYGVCDSDSIRFSHPPWLVSSAGVLNMLTVTNLTDASFVPYRLDVDGKMFPISAGYFGVVCQVGQTCAVAIYSVESSGTLKLAFTSSPLPVDSQCSFNYVLTMEDLNADFAVISLAGCGWDAECIFAIHPGKRKVQLITNASQSDSRLHVDRGSGNLVFSRPGEKLTTDIFLQKLSDLGSSAYQWKTNLDDSENPWLFNFYGSHLLLCNRFRCYMLDLATGKILYSLSGIPYLLGQPHSIVEGCGERGWVYVQPLVMASTTQAFMFSESLALSNSTLILPKCAQAHEGCQTVRVYCGGPDLANVCIATATAARDVSYPMSWFSCFSLSHI